LQVEADFDFRYLEKRALAENAKITGEGKRAARTNG
jgi:hypothetical protein